MKHLVLSLAGLAVLCVGGAFGQRAGAQETGMRRVYLMPMANGLDQHLASQLTHEHALVVVTDPKAADVILTDRIGDALERRLEELYPGPKPAAKADDKAADSKSAGAGDTAGAARREFRTTAAQGTIFMVDARSRQVVWADHEKPVQPSDQSLEREARRIVRKLQPAASK